ncbi:CD63 antigen-like [Cataglyphis hispanica]|uniref:CD63 antigen-like n=1 Tax=Cataglyphis hispanica TaxID=1086592 RepID=UPI00217FB898|nr:CD63 antigen-like [Cataglyphis hispanica]
MGCGMGMIKYLLFIFNFIFVLCGLAILVVGVLVRIGDQKYAEEMKTITGDLAFPSITLIVIGSIIFVIAFFGCCGAIRESHCMIVTFATLLLTILIIQVAVAIYAFVVLKNADEIDFKNEYAMNVFNYYTKRESQKELVDLIQQELECCGVESYKDFKTLNISIPGSCCGKDPTNVALTCSQQEAYEEGCVVALKDLFKSACAALGGIALGIAAIELIGIIFALCLANSIKNAERRGYSV